MVTRVLIGVAIYSSLLITPAEVLIAILSPMIYQVGVQGCRVSRL